MRATEENQLEVADAPSNGDGHVQGNGEPNPGLGDARAAALASQLVAEGSAPESAPATYAVADAEPENSDRLALLSSEPLAVRPVSAMLTPRGLRLMPRLGPLESEPLWKRWLYIGLVAIFLFCPSCHCVHVTACATKRL